MKNNFKLSFNTMSERIRIIGFIFILVGLIINPFTWVEFFDADGYLTGLNKLKILLFDTVIFTFGYYLINKPDTLVYYLNTNRIKIWIRKITPKLVYLIYIVVAIEFLSYVTLTVLLPENLINRVNLVLGKVTTPSTDISWQMADLWSNYKPNPLSKRCNQYGYRYGGGPKEKGKIRILCIGGSTTWGDGVDWGEQSYPAQLEKYLNNNGYSVDIVNSGVPYHTSAEVLTSLCFRGIYTEPDIVLIHTGGNDNGPLSSPNQYKSDYSHWRRVGGIISDNVFTEYYYKFPFSTFRLFLIYYLKPGTGNSVGKQLSWPMEEMLAKTDLKNIKPTGLITNFRNIISVSKSAGAKPIVILFNIDQDRKNSSAHHYFGNSDDFTYARNRTDQAMHINNDVMDSISNALNIPVIPFDKWNPTDTSSWLDHAHLDSTGIMEKAQFIGNYLINNKILEIIRNE